MLAFYLTLIDQEESRSLFETLYEQHRFTMLAMANRILHDPQLAEDAVHDAFLRIIGHLDKFPRMDCNKTRSYVVIIVKNIALDMLRRQNRLSECALPEFGEDLWDLDANVEQHLLDREAALAFSEGLRQLGQPQVDILTLKLVHGFKSREIAAMLKLPESTVRVYLHRGKKQLMRFLEVDTDAAPDIS